MGEADNLAQFCPNMSSFVQTCPVLPRTLQFFLNKIVQKYLICPLMPNNVHICPVMSIIAHRLKTSNYTY